MKWLSGVVMVVAASVAHAEPASLQAALEQSRKAGKPLVVELSAAWCAPCRLFADDVLRRDDVRDALRSVVFVTFDIDTPTGAAVAELYRVPGVPAFLVLDPIGAELARQQGLGHEHGSVARWFIGFLATAASGHQSTSKLVAAVQARPDDIHARIALARHFRELDRKTEAIEHYKIASASSDRAIASEAVAVLDDYAMAEARLTTAIETLEQFVTKFPDSARASSRLVVLAQSGRVERARLRDLVDKHLAAVADADLPAAVRAALSAGFADLALDQIRLRLARKLDDRDLHLLRVEIAIHGRANPALDATCTAPGRELWCYYLEQARADGGGATGPTRRMQRVATQFLRALERPATGTDDSEIGIDHFVDVDPVFANAFAKAVRDAQRACADQATDREHVHLLVQLQRERQHSVANVRSSKSAVARCMQSELRAHLLPPVPQHVDPYLVLPLSFARTGVYAAGTGTSDGIRARQTASSPRGALVALQTRVGDVGFGSIAFDVRVRLHELRRDDELGVAFQVEGLTSERGSGYIGRALVGASKLVLPRLMLSVHGGIGVSELGGMDSRAFELPAEARVRVALGAWRIHTVMQYRRLFGSELRRDEAGLGLGVTFPRSWVPLHLGIAYEQRGPDNSIAGTVGFALGSF